MKLKQKHLENEIKKAELELTYCYQKITERKQFIRILKILKNKIDEDKYNK
jgi:hypothetical protein